jgi:AcrR family transcriptional regulator
VVGANFFVKGESKPIFSDRNPINVRIRRCSYVPGFAKQDRSRRTEQQILSAALRVFARGGISRSRIADIAAEAGISTSTFYE